MVIKIGELFEKEVVCIKDGARLGRVGDIEIDVNAGTVCTLLIFGRARFFGLFGREDDILIPYSALKVVGDDIILVDYSAPPRRQTSLFRL